MIYRQRLLVTARPCSMACLKERGVELLRLWFIFILLGMLSACQPVKTTPTHQYQLTHYSDKIYRSSPKPHTTIFVTPPQGAAGYDTDQMLYISKPYALTAFANNAWTDPPKDMLQSLMIQSLQRSGYFKGITSTPYANKADYQLDTTLIELHQNFLTKPSHMQLKVKAVLSRTSNNQVLNSKIFAYDIPAPCDSPYGGVIAANGLFKTLTGDITRFVIHHL